MIEQVTDHLMQTIIFQYYPDTVYFVPSLIVLPYLAMNNYPTGYSVFLSLLIIINITATAIVPRPINMKLITTLIA
jgi:hypothetical protein